MYELTNNQREYFGLDPIQSHWQRILFKADTYRPESILYFDDNTIKRQIISTDNKYSELHYDELTNDKKILLPKTDKGKEKKLTQSVLEQRQPLGIYLSINDQDLTIGNYNTQKTFYSTTWEKKTLNKKSTIADVISDFIEKSPESHFEHLKEFKNANRKNVKFKSGDYFCFKLDRTSFGFGKLLLDVNKIRKKGLIPKNHGLSMLMGPPIIVQLFGYKSDEKNVSISTLEEQKKLPSDVMMDNLLLYGEYEIIGHKELNEEDFDFPISYGQTIDQRQFVFLQWGLIHRELPLEKFNRFLIGEKEYDKNPYGYYSIGFRPLYNTVDVARAIENNGIYDFANSDHYKARWDLRNPVNKNIKDEIFKAFELDPNKNYLENCKLTGTQKITEFIKQI